MKGKRYTKEFKDIILQEANETNDVALVARRHEISVKTIYRWRAKSKYTAWEKTNFTAKKTATYTPSAVMFH